MNTKRYILASIVAAVVAFILYYLLHEVLQKPIYLEYPRRFGSPDQMKHWFWMIPVSSLSLAFLLGYVFVRGYENGGTGEGVRFGVIIGAIVNLPRFFFDVVYYRFPKIYDISNLIGGMIIFLILGILYSLLYKPHPEDS